MQIRAEPPTDHRSGRAIQRDDDIASHNYYHPTTFEQYLSDKFDREHPNWVLK